MSHSDEDREIRRRFKSAHERRESLPPSFQEIVERARRQQTQPSVARVSVLVTAVVAVTVVISGYLVWYEQPVPQRFDNEISALTNWQSPTDFLLKTPGMELLASMPTKRPLACYQGL